MRPSSAKAKGRELQKRVAEMIREWGDLPEEDVVSRPMGSGGEDLMMSNAARRKFPISLECKNTKSFPSLAALRQSDYNKPESLVSAVAWHAPRSAYADTIVYLRLADLLQLIDRIRAE